MNIKRIIRLPKKIISRYLTNRKIKSILRLKSVKSIRREKERLHDLFLKAERNGDEMERLQAKPEVFDWLMKK